MEQTNSNVYRIAITGPESTGKSSLSRALATHYDTVWIPEYAREYLSALGRHYVEDDLMQIAEGHRSAEKKALGEAKKYLFTDTDPLVIKVWSHYKYGRIPAKINRWIKKEPYDLYLLCYPDLPWKADPMRENPEKGKFFFKNFETELMQNRLTYGIVKGEGEERLKNAIEIIENRFS